VQDKAQSFHWDHVRYTQTKGGRSDGTSGLDFHIPIHLCSEPGIRN
jgi:hypothetical protein